MDEAATLARSGDAGGVWIVADRQTGGRGRHGRVWVSEPGNLYATLLLIDPSPIAIAPQLGFVTGVALCDALRSMTDLGERVRLKWPNDLVVDGAKLAGLLLEGVAVIADGQRRHAVAIGIGLNMRSHPSGLTYAATDLHSLGYDIEPRRLLDVLSPALEARIAQWAAGDGFSLIREAWMKSASGLGKSIRVTLPDEAIDGFFKGIDQGGRLLIDTGQKTRTIDAGDVALR